MKLKKDLLQTGLGGFALAVLANVFAALMTGATLHAPFSFAWIKAILLVKWPFWGVLLFGSICVFATVVRNRLASQDANEGKEPTPSKVFEVGPLPNPTSLPVPNAAEPASVIRSQLVDKLAAESPDRYTVKFSTFEKMGRKGVQLTVENDRLTSIRLLKVLVRSLSSYDERYGAFREPIQVVKEFYRPNRITPSGSGESIQILWKEPENDHLTTGDGNITWRVSWPINDKSKVEQWKFSLAIQVFNIADDPFGKPIALKELTVEILVFWDRASNTFDLEVGGPFRKLLSFSFAHSATISSSSCCFSKSSA